MSRNSNKAGAQARMIALALAVVLALPGAQAHAEPAKAPHAAETAAPHRTFTDLEGVFWMCDHASTQAMLDMDTAASCATAMGELRERKFEGDLDAMLDWWQRNKAREHRLFDLRYRAAGRR